MTAGARLVKMDREESKSVIDMRKAMSRREPSNNVAPTKSTFNLVDGISKISHFLSGENIPFKSRMPVSSADSKSNQKEECDSRVTDCGAPAVNERTEERSEEKEVPGAEEMIRMGQWMAEVY